MADVFDQTVDRTKPLPKQQASPRGAPKPSGGGVWDQTVDRSASSNAQSPQGMPLAETAWGRAKQAYEGTLPLLDENMATLAGVGSIARGGVGAVKGGYEALKQALSAWNNPKAEVGDVVLPRPQVEQLPGAIRDINQSPDPTGTYLKAAGETAGQGAGSALTALASEGAARGLPKAIEAAGDIPVGRITKATGAAVKAGAGKFPIVGPPAKAATLAAIKSWRESAPAAPTYPGARFPTATPEQLNPSLVSPSRTLPGMNLPEVTGRPTPTPGPVQGPSRGLALPGDVEKVIPSSKVSTTPPKSPSPVSKAEVLSRLRSIAQQPGTGVTAPESTGPSLRVAGQSVPADTDLTQALQQSLPANRIQGKIMQIVRKEGANSAIDMDQLMKSPGLKGVSRQEILNAARTLSDQGKIWHDGATVALKKR